MINRALTRLKTVQILYAHYQNEGRKVGTSIKELDKSLAEAYELYKHMLALLTDVRYYAERRAESIEARAQRMRTHLEETSDDAILAANKFLLMLEQNEELQKFKEHRRELWQTGDTFLKRMTDIFTQSSIFGEYVAINDRSFEADREVIRMLYKQLMPDNEDVNQVLEENSIYWNDDRDIVDSFVLKTIKHFEESTTPDMPLLPDYDEGESPEFGHKLLQEAIARDEEIQQMIAARVKGWDFSRVAMMDILIMQLALTEILTFNEIPLNVTFNEYLNIAKCYSSPKSSIYINGVLDAVVNSLRAEGSLLK